MVKEGVEMTRGVDNQKSLDMMMQRWVRGEKSREGDRERTNQKKSGILLLDSSLSGRDFTAAAVLGSRRWGMRENAWDYNLKKRAIVEGKEEERRGCR